MKNIYRIMMLLLIMLSSTSMMLSSVQLNQLVTNGNHNIGGSNTSRNIALHPNDCIFAAWSGNSGVFVAKSSDGGQTFTDILVRDANIKSEVEIHIAANGNIYLAWNEKSGNKTYLWFSASYDGGLNYSLPRIIGEQDGDMSGIHIASYGSNVYILPRGTGQLFFDINEGVGLGPFDVDKIFESLNPLDPTINEKKFTDIHADPTNGDLYIIYSDNNTNETKILRIEFTINVNTPNALPPNNKTVLNLPVPFFVQDAASDLLVYNPVNGHGPDAGNNGIYRHLFILNGDQFGYRIDIGPFGPFDGNIVPLQLMNSTANESRSVAVRCNGFSTVLVDGSKLSGDVVFWMSYDLGMTWVQTCTLNQTNFHNQVIDPYMDFVHCVTDKDLGGQANSNDIYYNTCFTPPPPPDEEPEVNTPDLVLWFNPDEIDKQAYTTGDPIDFLQDWTSIEENGTQADPKKMPTYVENALNDVPGVQFLVDYGDHNFGYSDIIESPNVFGLHDEITTGVEDWYNPSQTDKSLFINFQISDYIDQPQLGQPYYSDGRQCIFEAGGPLSGFNLFLVNGKIFFGMWNRYEHIFIEFDPNNNSGIYPLAPGVMYMANLEFDGQNQRFRGLVGRENPIFPEVVMYPSPWLEFDGLTRDTQHGTIERDDKTGLGGACRTHYYDYSIGATYSDHFNGIVGDVMLYNAFFQNEGLDITADDVYNYFNSKYTTNFVYQPLPNVKQSMWRVIEDRKDKENTNILVADAIYPSPAKDQMNIKLYADAEDFVTIEIYDLQGNSMGTFAVTKINAGMNDIKLNVSKLQNGTYTFKINGLTDIEFGRFVIAK